MLMWPIIAVTSGVISIQHLLEDGRKTIAAFFMRGDIIDLRGASSQSKGQLIALNNAKVCRLSPEAFEHITETNINAQRIVWNNLREQNYRAIEHSADLAKKLALEKLASFIFECRRRQVSNVQTSSVTIPVRRIDLAEYLGMQPETVSRCFKILEERKIIEFSGISNIKILQPPVLRRIANGDKNTDTMRHRNNDHFKVLSFG
jgi:CRP-like cAMP-binding protein